MSTMYLGLWGCSPNYTVQKIVNCNDWSFLSGRRAGRREIEPPPFLSAGGVALARTHTTSFVRAGGVRVLRGRLSAVAVPPPGHRLLHGHTVDLKSVPP